MTARSILLHSRGQVHCEGNRLAGVLQRTLQQEDGKFDWKRFWSYLEPHLWEFLGAIAVSIQCHILLEYSGRKVTLVLNQRKTVTISKIGTPKQTSYVSLPFKILQLVQ